MNTPKVESLTSTSCSPPCAYFLRVGVLSIEGRRYTVSVESSNSLIKSPHEDTLDKIRDLVNFQLQHLSMKGVDLSTIVIQQLDERGLSYVKPEPEKDTEQKLLPYSEVDFVPYIASNLSMKASHPPSLQDPFIVSLKDAYKAIIHSLEEDTFPTSPKNFFNSRMDFAPKNEETIPNQPIINPSDEGTEVEEEEEISESEDENIGFISGWPNDLSQYNPRGIINSINGIINNIKFQFSRLSSRIESALSSTLWPVWPEIDAINPEEVIAKEEAKFRSKLSGSEQATLTQLATIKFD